jgi:NAD+ synthase (glutamine-hydrolysing)
MRTLTMTLAQLNWRVGAIEENAERMLQLVHQQPSSVDLILFSELALSGYPPEDLLFQADLHTRCRQQLQRLAQASQQTAILVGHPWQAGSKLFNALSLFWQGRLLLRYYKQQLPNYGVFDEQRYFTPGTLAGIVDFKSYRLGLLICEDLWVDDPLETLKAAGVELVLSVHASPYDRDKPRRRRQMIARQTRRTALPLIYLNQVGGQDELVFDGQSQIYTSQGQCCYRFSSFAEQLAVISVQEKQFIAGPNSPLPLSPLAQIYQALVLALRDYVDKNRFDGVILGLSGGIDSALTLAIAVDALGHARVQAVMMPSEYTSLLSHQMAEQQASQLKVSFSVVSITPLFEAFTQQLRPFLGSDSADSITHQNLQARCRGTLLMALANHQGKLVLTTGNKSELAVGYTTLYGDMVGGFAVLKDVLKTLVYQLARYRNRQDEVIPQQIIARPPSAELAPGQCDQDSLPPYEILDRLLQGYVEQDQTTLALVAQGFDAQQVDRMIQLVDYHEYKRRQAAVGPRITARNFGKDRRYPITYWKGPV